MATTSISITPQFGNNSVIAINCGTSSPRLSGTIDISAFPNLQEFRCIDNDITAVTGYENNSNLRIVQFFDNKVTGSILSLSGLTNLEDFRCYTNQLTGPIPALSGLTKLEVFWCQNQSGTKLTGPIPALSGLTKLRTFRCNNNQLAADIPSLSGLNNLEVFYCYFNQLTGSIPSLGGLTNLQDFRCNTNQLTGSIPSLSGLNNLQFFNCEINQLTGPIPSLSSCTSLRDFRCQTNRLTGPIPSLQGLSSLQIFFCQTQAAGFRLSGSIPSLSSCTVLQDFRCHTNLLTGFDGGSVSNTLGQFEAQSNQLNQSSIDAILLAFDATTRTTGTRNLFLQAGTNAAPSYTGGVTTVSAGNLFTTLGTVVTAQCTNHGHPNNSLVTLSGNGGFQSVFTGTFQISAINANQFRYTVSTNSPTLVTGTGQVAMRRTTNATDGFRYYQNLALVSRYGTASPVLTGFPWSVNINFP